MTKASVLLALAVVLTGCGYALAGRGNTLPEYIRRIGVPGFQNLSTTPELDRLFTDAIKIELQSRGKYTVVADTAGVDAVLSGSILSVTPVATAFTSDNLQALKYTVNVVASAEFKETRDNKVFWSSPSLQVSDEYELASGVAVNDLASLFTQDRNVLERLARTFARTLVTNILEAF